MPDPTSQPDWPPDPSRDPRTRIPEVLRDRPPQSAPPEPTEKSVGRQISDIGSAWGVAFNFVATVIAGAVIGWLIDWWRGTGPWGVLIGLGFGFVVALVQIVRFSLRQDRIESQARSDRKNSK